MPLRAAAVGVISIAALALLGCRGSSASPATPSSVTEAPPPAELQYSATDPIVIGVSVPLTPADQKRVGDDIYDAARLAVADYGGSVRGRPIEVVAKDDGCNDPETSASAAKALVEQPGIVAVVGPVCTTAAQVADAMYEDAQLIHISPAVTRPELSAEGERYFFRTAWRDDAQARTQAEYARHTLNASSAIVIDDGDPYGKSLADAFVAAFEGDGGRTLAHERIDPSTTDYPPLATRLAAMGADAIVFEGLNPAAARIITELHKAGFAGAFIAPDAAFSVRDFLQTAGDAANGSVVTAGPLPDVAFGGRFHDLTQRNPSTAFTLEAHDAVTALLRAVDAVAVQGSDGLLHVDREALAGALRSRTFSGLTGTIRFDDHGDRAGDTPSDAGITIYRVNGGRFEAVP